MVIGRVSDIAVRLNILYAGVYWYALHSTISNSDILWGETLFLRYGSNVRRIIDMLDLPKEEGRYNLEVKSGATNIAKDFLTILLQLEHLDSNSEPSSKIFAVRPNNLELRLPVLTIPTPFLFNTLLMAVSHHAEPQQHQIFMMLTSHPFLGTTAGWWFENYAHIRLSDLTRSPIQTHISSVSNPLSIPAPWCAL